MNDCSGDIFSSILSINRMFKSKIFFGWGLLPAAIKDKSFCQSITIIKDKNNTFNWMIILNNLLMKWLVSSNLSDFFTCCSKFFYLRQFLFFLCFNFISTHYHTPKHKKNNDKKLELKINWSIYLLVLCEMSFFCEKCKNWAKYKIQINWMK